jgi:cytochrome c-type biogenesis protein CcmH
MRTPRERAQRVRGQAAVADSHAPTPRRALAATPSLTATLAFTAMLALAVTLALSPTLGGASAAAATPRTTMPVIERQVMCVTCKIPLNVAESPQSQRERAFIRGLIAEGRTEAQIKNALVAQYGPSVLALPSAKGFDLAAYLAPIAVVLALLGLLALLLPSWRRQARARTAATPSAPELSASDAARLDADLKRFD